MLRAIARYGMAMALTGVAIAVRFALDPWFGAQLPFISFFPVVAASIWFAGLGPATLSALLGLFAASYFFLPPRFSFELSGMPAVTVYLAYVTSCGLIILLGEIARRRHAHSKQYLEALEESEQRFRQMADKAPVLIWVSDQHKQGIYFNRTWLEFTGRPLERELGEGWLESVHADDRAALVVCAQALDARRPFTTQFRLRHASGEYRWVFDSGVPRFDADGTFLGFIGSCVDIHARKLAEESGAWLAAIVSASQDAIVSKTLDGKILSWNAGAERMFGYRAKEVVGESIDLIIPDELRDEERSILERLRRGERIDHFGTVRVTRDGRRLDVSLTVSPVREDAGRIVGASMIARDITTQKRADEALRLSEERYRAVVESQTEMLCRFRADGTIIFVNEAYARSQNLTAEQLIGRSFWDFVAAEDSEGVAAMLASLTPEQPEARIENRIETTDGVRWLLWANRALRFDSAGRAVETQATGVDITDRKQMEEALRQSEHRFSRFMQHLPGLAWIKDLEGRYVYANEAATHVFGAPRGELLGLRDEDIFPAEKAAEFRENDRRALSNESGIQIEETLTHPDGVTHFSLVSKFPIPAPDGAPALVGGVAIDISERKHAEEALRVVDRRKDEFMAVLGHELRNPLAPLRSGLEILSNAGESIERVRTMMERQLLHLLRLVDDLLDVSRISRGVIELKRTSLDLRAIVDAALEQAAPILDEREHRVTVEHAESPLPVNVDPERVTQVVVNLLSNAAKYSDIGSAIEIRTCESDSRAMIRVIDSGFGIPPERLATLFEFFNQVPEHQSKTGGGGLGIGLALARRIIELHGGSIEVGSRGLGHGSEFVVSLPSLEAGLVPSITPPAATPAPEPVAADGSRVLIVDDNIDAAESLRMLLEHDGYLVRAVYDGPAALEAAERFEPAVVLLDIGLPGMDGYEVARRIRAMPHGQDIRICAITGWGQQEDKTRAHVAGFDEHLTKPVDPKLLSTLIATRFAAHDATIDSALHGS